MAATTPPLSLGEILDRTVQLYRRNFTLFVGISLLPAAFDVLVSGGVSIYSTSVLPAFKGTGPAATQALIVFFVVIALFVLIGVPLLVAVFSLSLSALNYAAFQRNRGDAITIRATYAYGFRHFWRYLGIFSLQVLFAGVIPGAVFFFIVMIGAMLTALVATTGAGKALTVVFGLLIFLFVIALFVVAIWIWLRYCLAFPACITEEKKVWPSMQRSVRLSKGSRGRIFVMYLLVVILTVISYYALTAPVDIVLKFTVYKSMAGMAMLTKPPILLQVVNLFISFLERSFVMPIYAIALLLFYNDQRTRQEGYDIELLMAQAGWSTLPPPPPIELTPAVEIPIAELLSESAPGSAQDAAPVNAPSPWESISASIPEVVAAPDPPEVPGA
jgi:hypothetical protein